MEQNISEEIPRKEINTTLVNRGKPLEKRTNGLPFYPVHASDQSYTRLYIGIRKNYTIFVDKSTMSSIYSLRLFHRNFPISGC